MAYLVTGGAGFIGSHLVDALAAKKNKVIVVDDFSSGKETNLSRHKNSKHLVVYKRSVCDNLKEIFQNNIHTVFHFAALSKVAYSLVHPLKTHQANVEGTVNILEMARTFKVKRVVFASSSSVYGDAQRLPMKETTQPRPLSPYALQKLIGEEYCKLYCTLYGVQTIILRYFNVFGPRQNPEGAYGFLIPKFIALISKQKIPTVYGNGTQSRDFIYIDDVIEATLKAASSSNPLLWATPLNVGSGENVSVNDAAKAIAQFAEKKTIKPHYAPWRNEPRHTLADISKIRRMLGWKPKTPFKEGLRKTYTFYSHP